MTSLTFTVPGPPVGKQRARVVRAGTGSGARATIVHRNSKRVRAAAIRPQLEAAAAKPGVRSFTPPETKAYEELIGWCAIAAGARRARLQPPYKLTVRIWWPDARRRDADNVLKATQDALNHVVWTDDSQITETRTVVEGIDRENPRILITVEGA